MKERIAIQLFPLRLSNKTKARDTMTIDIDSLSSLDLGFSVFQPEGKGSMSTRVCVVFLLSR